MIPPCRGCCAWRGGIFFGGDERAVSLMSELLLPADHDDFVYEQNG